MENWRIILEIDREPQYLQAVWRLDSIARLIQQALNKVLKYLSATGLIFEN